MHTPAKLITAAAISFILGFGLCATGSGFDTHATNFQIAITYVGAALFFLAFILLIVASAKRGRQRKGS